MLNVAFGVILLFFVLFVMGIGPSLLFLKLNKHSQIAYFIAPVIGLVFTSIFGTYFVLLNLQISLWATFWFLVSVLFTVIVLFATFLRREFVIDKKMLVVFCIGLVFLFFLLLAPMVIGGPHFTVLRGNGTDTFNYMTMAGCLLNKPYLWINQASTKELIDAHPSYALAKELLTTRWTTSMLLAWCSKIVNIPIYKLEYGFTTLFFMLLYCGTFVFSTLLKIPLRYVLLLSLAVCIGFWAQVVLDIRAMSQISALPLIMLVGILVVNIDGDDESRRLGAKILLGLIITALFFLYAEIMPTVVLGVLIYWLIRFCHKGYSFKKIREYFLSILIAVIAFLPASKYLIKFFSGQIQMAASFKNDWHHAYFHWLYSQPLNGFWGLSKLHLPKDWFFIKVALLIVVVVLSLILSFAFILTIVKTLSRKNKKSLAHIICVAFVLSVFLEFLFLFFKGQLWAAAKTLTYGYPFIMLTLVSGVLAKDNCCLNGIKLRFVKICKFAVILWLVFQCGFGLYRVVMVSCGKIPSYIANHGDYLKHDWNADIFLEYFKKNTVNVLGIYVPNSWEAEYFGFVFGYNMHVINLNGIQNRDGKIISSSRMDKFPSYIIIKKDFWCGTKNMVEAENSEYKLIKYSRNFENCLKNYLELVGGDNGKSTNK